jgi:hypothetical protein
MDDYRRVTIDVAELRRPECYPHPTAGVEIVQTHISIVCLAGDRVYKLKKPVTLPFLDFSTPALREHFCREELRLNRRVCPWVYLDVVPLQRSFRDDAVAADPTMVPMASSLWAATAATCARSRCPAIGRDVCLIVSTAVRSPRSSPRFKSIALAPATTLRIPSLRIAWATIVAVLVPSPTASAKAEAPRSTFSRASDR